VHLERLERMGSQLARDFRASKCGAIAYDGLGTFPCRGNKEEGSNFVSIQVANDKKHTCAIAHLREESKPGTMTPAFDSLWP
jgi:hypothetical protein